MARKAFIVNEALREKVRHLGGRGVSQDNIAKIIGRAPKTLRKHFRDDLDCGVAETNAAIADSLFAAAMAGNVTAMIFWLKCRGGWRERAAADETGPAGDESNPEILVLPDNCRDPELTKSLRDAQRKYFARRRRRKLP